MMRRYFLPVLLFFSACSLFGQSQDDGTLDDPNFAKFMGQIGLGVETDFSHRTEVPITIGLHYDFTKLPFEIEAAFNVSVFGDRKNDLYAYNQSDNEYQNFNSFDAGVVYNFFDKTEEKSVRVVVHRSSKEGPTVTTKTERSVHVAGMVRDRFGIRAGIYRYAQSITDYDAIDQSIVFADGTTFPDAENPWQGAISDGDRFFYTAERHLSTYLGFVFHRSFGRAINHTTYGKRRNMSNRFIYADVLIDLASDIQKLSYQGQLYDLHEATSGVDLSPIGFRIGMKNTDGIIFYKLEFGMRPQYFQKDIYALLSVGYSFNKNF